jgi:acetolactate synthase small subunit
MGKFKSILELLKEEDQLVNELRELKKESTNRTIDISEITHVVESINYTRECITHHLNDILNEYNVKVYLNNNLIFDEMYVCKTPIDVVKCVSDDMQIPSCSISKLSDDNTLSVFNIVNINNGCHDIYNCIVKFERRVK